MWTNYEIEQKRKQHSHSHWHVYVLRDIFETVNNKHTDTQQI